ncbi:hypothetical protein G3821_005658 [Escherichia coli]|nr:hypothetical protein [Escherichia coli]
MSPADKPAGRVSAQIRLTGKFRFLAHSLTTFGRWGCGERWRLSHNDRRFIHRIGGQAGQNM